MNLMRLTVYDLSRLGRLHGLNDLIDVDAIHFLFGTSKKKDLSILRTNRRICNNAIRPSRVFPRSWVALGLTLDNIYQEDTWRSLIGFLCRGTDTCLIFHLFSFFQSFPPMTDTSR